MKQIGGFSLVEMLIVLSVVGILTALGFSSLEGLRRSSELREVQFKVGGDFERARQFARRYGVRYLVEINETTGDYVIKPVDVGGLDITTYPKIQGKITTNTEFVTAGDGSFFITGPFGKLVGSPMCVAINLKNTNLVAEIHLVGVTANVINRTIKAGGGCV
jgi:prepilin-type N-terminal cleavage/methylation domain-containing protein